MRGAIVSDRGDTAGRPPAVLRAADGRGTLAFDRADYDVRADRLRLTRQPVCAASTERTPEGHLVRVAAPDGVLCDLVLTDVRRRLVRHGRVEVTLDPCLRVVLDPDDVTRLLGESGPGR